MSNATTTTFGTTDTQKAIGKITRTVGYAYFFFTFKVMVVMVMGYMIISHAMKVYSDLFTSERESTKHRRKAPEITKMYKWASYLSLVVAVGFCIAELLSIFFTVAHGGTCLGVLHLSSVCYQTGKTALYLTFLVRLQMVFGNSKFKYSPLCYRLTLALILVVWLLGVLSVLLLIKVSTYGYHTGNDFPNFCHSTFDSSTTFGGLLILQDLLIATGLLIAFLVPLRKTIKSIEIASSDLPGSNKIMAKIAHIGTKTTICTATAVVSSLVSYVITASADWTRAVWAIDIMINTTCLLLMTPYYPDDRFYNTLCHCCIVCCDRKRYSLRDPEDDKQEQQYEESRTNMTAISTTNTNTTTNTATNTNTNTVASDTNTNTVNTANTATSVDTMDQLQKSAAAVAPGNPEVNTSMSQDALL